MSTALSSLLERVPPHLRIESFLGPALIARLLAHVAAHEQDFVPTKVGRGEMRGVKPLIRASRRLRDLGALRPELEERFQAIFERARRALGVTAMDVHKLELELVAHGDGDFYRRHTDTVTGALDNTSDRALTAVYYFHREPRAFTGGALRLHPLVGGGEPAQFVDIPPDNDTLVLFVSWVPHEVRPVSCPGSAFLDSRFAINCWYRKKREP